mmetsp:Transcript_14598/g.55148  ORF Transcript_14598/g.55148 Transcript_14598/m.55148 type:complete len:250 (-) Transcript_14598:240-989(-)
MPRWPPRTSPSVRMRCQDCSRHPRRQGPFKERGPQRRWLRLALDRDVATWARERAATPALGPLPRLRRSCFLFPSPMRRANERKGPHLSQSIQVAEDGLVELSTILERRSEVVVGSRTAVVGGRRTGSKARRLLRLARLRVASATAHLRDSEHVKRCARWGEKGRSTRHRTRRISARGGGVHLANLRSPAPVHRFLRSRRGHPHLPALGAVALLAQVRGRAPGPDRIRRGMHRGGGADLRRLAIRQRRR